ncbi:hypothetical protein [Pseudomonas typographi]|uniref:Transmembrane protein n=1 Tax=Pseudomonas typographi TaxID=2715964 RepID=A0ABR7Z6E9_9PSED|nr:hypothetical protein [Pseudomonas typographi]MBD1554488.1 hypothetical protein [Pseudomonas typographi]MBD1590136.1 hypothetical protein [Pseudomonas typographi]MBD1601091.1 hypothetical protein [Pseudomonas typographi]
MTTPTEYSTATAHSQNRSGVSWAAVFAGAAGAAALSLILVLLGAGLGFAASSPWAGEGASAKALGVSTIVWLLVTQILASGLGGYLAGRLRVKWASLHGDEVYFRDTAHGFLSWAVATLVAAVLIVSSAGHLASAGASAGASAVSGAATMAAGAAGGAAASGQGSDSNGYFVDTLLRGNNPGASSEQSTGATVGRIFAKALAGNDGQLTGDDRAYLAQLVAQRAQLSQAQAEQRVDQVYGQARQAANDAKTAAKQAADTAAKVAAWTSIWTFIALLCGAFIASAAALFGGRLRDRAQWLEGTSERDAHLHAHATTAQVR